jgi:hypothetical protein
VKMVIGLNPSPDIFVLPASMNILKDVLEYCYFNLFMKLEFLVLWTS